MCFPVYRAVRPGRPRLTPASRSGTLAPSRLATNTCVSSGMASLETHVFAHRLRVCFDPIAHLVYDAFYRSRGGVK